MGGATQVIEHLSKMTVIDTARSFEFYDHGLRYHDVQAKHAYGPARNKAWTWSSVST